MAARSRHIWGTVRAGALFFESEFLPQQKKVGQQTQGHVVMPAGPAASFVVLQAQELPSFLKAGIDGPTHGGQPHQLRPRHLRRTLNEIGFELCSPWVSAQEQPEIGTGRGGARGHHPQGRRSQHTEAPDRPLCNCMCCQALAGSGAFLTSHCR